jgi:hypothetical protein
MIWQSCTQGNRDEIIPWDSVHTLYLVLKSSPSRPIGELSRRKWEKVEAYVKRLSTYTRQQSVCDEKINMHAWLTHLWQLAHKHPRQPGTALYKSRLRQKCQYIQQKSQANFQSASNIISQNQTKKKNIQVMIICQMCKPRWLQVGITKIHPYLLHI